MKLDVTQLLTKIEESKAIIAKERDKLRDIYDDLESVLESFESGIDEFDWGIQDIKNGIEKLSEVV